MPTQTEIRAALDIMQALLTGPLPNPRQRAEMFQQVYRVLRKLLPEQAAGELPEQPGASLLDDPLLAGILELDE